MGSAKPPWAADVTSSSRREKRDYDLCQFSQLYVSVMDIKEEGYCSKDCAKNLGGPGVRIQTATLNEHWHQTPTSLETFPYITQAPCEFKTNT